MKHLFTLIALAASLLIVSCAGEAAKCGDGAMQGIEQCDDGNIVGGDGCSSNCKLEAVCNNGVCENEEIHTCPQDCEICGNDICNANESVATCTPDCYCTNGSCDEGENATVCPQDCQNIPDCGDDICELSETISSCLNDCYCTNGSCDEGESQATCPQDCTGAICGNNICETGEIPQNCPADCDTGAVCGNNTCENGENSDNCPADCETAPYCGDGACNGTETATSCPADCGSPVTCGNGNIDAGESCDGVNLNGASCLTLGFDVGTLTCNANCTYNQTGCSSDTCTLFPNAGCPPGEKCTVDTLTDTRCNTAGLGTDGQMCMADSDCAIGYGCGALYNGSGICRKFCESYTAYSDSADCTDGAGSICKHPIGIGQSVVSYAKNCTVDCDPLTGTGCGGSGTVCDLGSDPPSGTGAFYTDCYDISNPQNYCGTQTCAQSYTCITDNVSVFECYKLCSNTNTSCPQGACTLFQNITEFGFVISVGGIQYGLCL